MQSKLADTSSWLMDIMPSNGDEVFQFIRDHKWALMSVGTITYVAYKANQLRQLPPGPYGLPVLGFMLQASGFGDGTAQKKMAKYGDISSVQVGSDLQVWINSSTLLKEAFVKRSSEFSFRPYSNWTEVFDLDDDIFSPRYDDQWKRNKNTIMGALKKVGFGSSSLETKIESEAHALIERLIELQTKAGDEGVDVVEPLRWTAGNLICNIIYNQHYQPDDEELRRLLKLSADMVALDVMTFVLVESMPFWIGRRVFKATLRESKEKGEKLQEFFRTKIDAHVTSRTPGEPRDFIDAYLDEWDGPHLNYKKMAGNCMVFLPDALDTLPKMLEWLVVCIAAYPDVQAKLHKELDEVVGRSREPTMKDKVNLCYLEACVHECFRFSNIFFSLPAHTVEKDTPLAGYTLPKGCQIMGNVLAIHSNPETFPNPEEYQPERHIDANGKYSPSEHVVAFGVGPRACAGQHLSKMEVFLLAAKLFHRLVITFPEGEDAKSCLEGTMKGFQRSPKDNKLMIKLRA